MLQCVNISVVPEEICSSFYAPVYHPSMFCAGGGQDRKDSCNVRDGAGEREGGGAGTVSSSCLLESSLLESAVML